MNTAHERHVDGKDEWLTPPGLINQLGEFDLDPCAPIKRPWETAKKYYTIEDDGLKQEWSGRVWCNPPYGRKTNVWLKKCLDHGNAMVLTFARTDTKMFHDLIWYDADAIFFFKGRIRFYHASGIGINSNAGAPSVLVAYGQNNVDSLRQLTTPGKLLLLK